MITNLSPVLVLLHDAQTRFAYQGVPSIYSEVATGKAYLICEATPCNQLEVPFQVVKFWTVDGAILPVEDSLCDSIHCFIN